MKLSKPKHILFFIISIIFIGFSNCTSNIESGYKYLNGFGLYMKSVFNVNIYNPETDIMFYAILVNGCEPCVFENTKMLNSIVSNNLVLILVGDLKESSGYESFVKYSNKFTTFNDKNYEIFSYETGISKPLLIHMKNGKCVKFLKVSDFDVDKAKEYIISNK